MCSICGAADFHFWGCPDTGGMNAAMKRRGPDQSGEYRARRVSLGHNRLAVIDVENGRQPLTVNRRGVTYTIVYNGEIYNMEELTAELVRAGAEFRTRCDTEVVLWAYILWGKDSPKRLNGIFAYCILSESVEGEHLFLVRDRFGIKPLYFTEVGGKFYFSSELKGLLAHADVRPVVDRRGLWELFFLTPVTLRGSGIFKGIRQLLPGYAAEYGERGLCTYPYWQLRAEECRDSREQAIETTRVLVTDAIRRQLVSDVPLCTFLSGGLDSSVVTAIAAKAYREKGNVLATYSFEYEGNHEDFHASLFQPQSDDEFAAWLAERLGTDHTILTASTEDVADSLAPAVLARDFPGQADIDSSLLWYCSQVKKRHTVALSGECSDEIFGGYPWFYRPEMLSRDFYPWIHEPMARIGLLRPEVACAHEGFAYLSEKYRSDLASCPVVDGESPEDRTARIATWLSTRYFMTSLLERKDRMSMWSGLEVRVPFGDHRILEYVFNLPWAYKMENGHEKSLLREAMRGDLPERILWRKKSPYPKTHNPAYEERVLSMVRERIARKQGFLHEYLDKKKLRDLLDGGDVTWFGQLMARPQLLAWLYQLDVWAERYRVEWEF